MGRHLAECPLAVIECEFKLLGCNEEVTCSHEHFIFIQAIHINTIFTRLTAALESPQISAALKSRNINKCRGQKNYFP